MSDAARTLVGGSLIGGSLVERAVRRVREHIRSHDLKVGDTLPGEGHFASDLGVSRAVMREAFGALAALRVLDVGNGRRARVGAIDGSVMATSIDHAVATAQVSVAEVWEVRRTLEMRTADLAARHRSAVHAAAIIAAAEAMAASGGDLDAIAHHDIRFHQTIAEASGNTLFLQIVRSFEPLMRVAVPAAWTTRTTETDRERVMSHHLELARAIERSAPSDARAAMDQHFDLSVENILVRV